MDWTHYRFHTVWELPAPPADVYTVLEQAETYPRWWPQVREVTPVDEHSAVIRIRSVLPYDIARFGAGAVRPAALVRDHGDAPRSAAAAAGAARADASRAVRDRRATSGRREEGRARAPDTAVRESQRPAESLDEEPS